MEGEGRFDEIERLLAQIGVAEYLAQLFGGVIMSQGEIVRLHELGLGDAEQIGFLTSAVRTLIVRGHMRRMGRGYAKKKNWKKAIVSLKDGDTIEFFEGA
jgi:hypothetical protein